MNQEPLMDALGAVASAREELSARVVTARAAGAAWADLGAALGMSARKAKEDWGLSGIAEPLDRFWFLFDDFAEVVTAKQAPVRPGSPVTLFVENVPSASGADVDRWQRAWAATGDVGFQVAYFTT